MDLKTKHVQGEALPTPDDPKPIVDCTFVTGELVEKDKKKDKNWLLIYYPQFLSYHHET